MMTRKEICASWNVSIATVRRAFRYCGIQPAGYYGTSPVYSPAQVQAALVQWNQRKAETLEKLSRKMARKMKALRKQRGSSWFKKSSRVLTIEELKRRNKR